MERDELVAKFTGQGVTDKDNVYTLLREENAQLKTKLAGATERNEKLEDEAKRLYGRISERSVKVDELMAQRDKLEAQLLETARVKATAVEAAPLTWWQRMLGRS